MDIIRFLIYLDLYLLFVSCSSLNQDQVKIIPEPILLECSKLNINLITKFPAFIKVNSNNIIVLNPYDEKGIIHFYDTSSGQLSMQFGKLGKGPYEFLTPTFAGENAKNTELNLFDPNLHKFYSVQLKKYPNIEFDLTDLKKCRNNYEQIIKLKEDLFAGLCFNPVGKLEVFDSKGIIYDHVQFNSFSTKAGLKMQAYLAFNSDMDLLIAASYKTGYIAAYNLNSKHIFLKWELSVTPVITKISDNRLVLDPERNKSGFSEIKFSNNKIFALYKGKLLKDEKGRTKEALPQSILVISTNGEILKNYKFCYPIKNFYIDNPGTKITAITLDMDFEVYYAQIPIK
jgi:hypothetical protein